MVRLGYPSTQQQQIGFQSINIYQIEEIKLNQRNID
jgi:hypothetical protein